MLRMKGNKECTSLIPYNVTSESTFFKDEMPLYPLEFAKNKLLVTSYPLHMYLVVDWCVVKFIPDPKTANINKSYAFTMPSFHEKFFPFIVICGEKHISILNIDTLEH